MRMMMRNNSNMNLGYSYLLNNRNDYPVYHKPFIDSKIDYNYKILEYNRNFDLAISMIDWLKDKNTNLYLFASLERFNGYGYKKYIVDTDGRVFYVDKYNKIIIEQESLPPKENTNSLGNTVKLLIDGDTNKTRYEPKKNLIYYAFNKFDFIFYKVSFIDINLDLKYIDSIYNLISSPTFTTNCIRGKDNIRDRFRLVDPLYNQIIINSDTIENILMNFKLDDTDLNRIEFYKSLKEDKLYHNLKINLV